MLQAGDELKAQENCEYTCPLGLRMQQHRCNPHADDPEQQAPGLALLAKAIQVLLEGTWVAQLAATAQLLQGSALHGKCSACCYHAQHMPCGVHAVPMPLTLLMQVNCKPPGGIQIRLIQYRPTLGGYLKLAVLDVAGTGGLTAVGVKSTSDVSPLLLLQPL